METQIKSKKIAALDGIKALAILAIIFYHLLPHKIPGGFLGVDIFLVLSGYFTMDAWLPPTNNTSFLSYIKKQVGKLFPALAFMCLTVLSYATLFQQQALISIRKTFWASLLFVNNIWQIITGSSYFDTGFNQSTYTHLWYVALNVQLYVVLAFFIYLFKKRKPLLLVLPFVSLAIMGIIFLLTNDINRVYYGTDTRAFSFFIGVLLAYVYPKHMFVTRIKSNKIPFLFGAFLWSAILLTLFMFNLEAQNTFLYYGGFLLFDLIFTIFVISSVHKDSFSNRLLSFPPLAYLGKRSYHYYLWYYPCHYFYTLAIPNINDHITAHIIVQLILIFISGEISFILFDRFQWQALIQQIQHPSTPRQKRLPIVGVLLMGSALILTSMAGLFLVTPPDNTSAKQLKQTIESNEKALSQKKTVTSTVETTTSTTETTEATTTTETQSLEELENAYAQNLPITFVGDSVLLAISEPLSNRFPHATINGKVSRQFFEGANILADMIKNGQVQQTVVIILGSNGLIRLSQLEQLIQQLGEHRKIFFVNNSVPNTWQNDNNAALQAVADKYANVFVIDWHHMAKNNPQLLYDDLVHPNEAGAPVFAQFIVSQIYQHR